MTGIPWEQAQELASPQAELRPSLERVQEWADQNEEHFAGLWIDNDAFLEAGGPVMVGVAVVDLDLTEAKELLDPLMDDPARLRLILVARTLSALRQAQDHIAHQFMRHAAADQTRLVGASADIKQNDLQVILHRHDPQLERRIRESVTVPVRIAYGIAYAVSEEARGARE